jgi:hypothetical protein
MFTFQTMTRGKQMLVVVIGILLLTIALYHTSHVSPITFLPRTIEQQIATRISATNPESKPACHAKLNTPESWSEPAFPTHLQNVGQEDPELIEHICQQWIVAPSSKDRRLKEPDKVHYSQNNQSVFVDQILAGRTNGFYVECGAYDGELMSNTLFFEKSRNWSGVLIEASDDLFKAMLKINRHAYLVNAGLSPRPRPLLSTFMNLDIGWGGLTDYMDVSHKDRIRHRVGEVAFNSTHAMQCLPLFSILQAIGVRHVDYFSLDIEGAELEVLLTLPLDKITVDVFSIEYVVGGTHASTLKSQQKLEAIEDYLVKKHQYEMVTLKQSEDVIFKRKGI